MVEGLGKIIGAFCFLQSENAQGSGEESGEPAEVLWFLKGMVRPTRFERVTYSFGGCCSIQLSYGRVIEILHDRGRG